MDKALAESLDRYIFKLQEVAHQLRGSRTGEFRKANRNNAAIALKSAPDFLAYCALVALFRRNIGRLSEPSCVAVISVPSHWQLADVDEAAKIIGLPWDTYRRVENGVDMRPATFMRIMEWLCGNERL